MYSKIDVVIPSYNHARYVQYAIESVVKQTAEEFEVNVIVIDDCSTDESVEKIEMMQKLYPFIFLKNSINTGKDNFGLQGIEERVRMLKGTIKFITKPGEGTEILINTPYLNKQ